MIFNFGRLLDGDFVDAIVHDVRGVTLHPDPFELAVIHLKIIHYTIHLSPEVDVFFAFPVLKQRLNN